MATPEVARRDLSKFDLLGPRARAAIAESPRDVDTLMVIRSWKNTLNYDCDTGLFNLPLDDPRVDAEIAEHVRKMIRKKLGKPADSFVIVRRHVRRR